MEDNFSTRIGVLYERHNPRVEMIKKWLAHRDNTYEQIYGCVLEQYPQLEGCDIRLPEDREEEQKVRQGLGLFSVVKSEPAVIKNFDSHVETGYFIKTHKEYIRYLSAQLGMPVHVLRNDPRLVSYYSFLHELGHAQHFFGSYVTGGSADLESVRLGFQTEYDKTLFQTKELYRGIRGARWSVLYWNMPFEKEANDFAVPLMKVMLDQEIIEVI